MLKFVVTHYERDRAANLIIKDGLPATRTVRVTPPLQFAEFMGCNIIRNSVPIIYVADIISIDMCEHNEHGNYCIFFRINGDGQKLPLVVARSSKEYAKLVSNEEYYLHFSGNLEECQDISNELQSNLHISLTSN